MDYFSKFLRSSNQTPSARAPIDHAQEFQKSWLSIKSTLQHPDERQLSRGIKFTDVPAQLQSMVDALVWESTRTEAGGTGACLESLLKNDVLDSLVQLSENDRPSGIQAEVLRTVQNMVVLLDEQFLVHSAVHRAVLRLLRNCIGDDMQEQLDGRGRVMGAARNAVRGQPSEYEEDLVNLLCILCSRIRTFRELLMIFFHDKHWYHSEPNLFSVEEDEDEDDLVTEDACASDSAATSGSGSLTPTSTRAKATSLPMSSATRKPEYEFLLFNYLLRFVHREGNIGDFARAGVLFLMDVAMSPGEQTHRIAGGESHSSLVEAHGAAAPTDPISVVALALAEYILDGDFSDVLGAGLSAVYSLLPRKLVFLPPSKGENGSGTGMILGQKGYETEEEKEQRESAQQRELALGIEEANSDDFRSRLNHFLKFLEFIQDIFKRNVTHESLDPPSLMGSAIVHSILDAVRRVFLENILYPSILECSDTDGSAVAVMSYIETMVRTLPDGQLNDLLVDFLVSEDNEDVRVGQGRVSRPEARSIGKLGTLISKPDRINRIKSSAMVLLEMEAPESRRKSEYFTSMGRFTLKDLILTNLRSQSQPTATCALQLLQTMFAMHPRLSIDKLLLVIHDPHATSFPHPFRTSALHEDNEEYRSEGDLNIDDSQEVLKGQPETTFTTHEREMQLYLMLVSRVDPMHEGNVFSTGYDRYLRDAIFEIQSQQAYHSKGNDDADLEFRRKIKHRLNVNDPILALLLESLRTFFSNTSELNLALSGALATLAMHPDRSLAGWLTFGTPDRQMHQTLKLEKTSSPYQDDDNRSIDYEITERLYNDEISLPASRMDENSRPVIHTIIHGLVTQIDKYRQMVDDFDKYLMERRQGLLFSENLTDALNLVLDIGEEPIISSAPVDASSKAKTIISASASLVSFLAPRKNKSVKLSNPPESNTPSKHENKNVASTFEDHYRSTSSVVLEQFVAPASSSGPWMPHKSLKWNAAEEDVFNSSNWSEQPNESSTLFPRDKTREMETPEKHRTTRVTLSQLLDNVVILEECIKELVSIIHARRSLGIDSVRYL